MTTKPRLLEISQFRSRAVGLAVVVFSGLYLLSDVVEAIQGRFSDPQLFLTLAGEAAIPFFVMGLYGVQRPQLGRLGLLSALAYAYSFVFFTGTVLYAISNSTSDYLALTRELGPSMTFHGAIMVVAGIGFGWAVCRARVLPPWTGIALAAGVVAVALTQAAPIGVQLVAAGIRAAAFAGMGFAVVHLTPTGNSHRRPSDTRSSRS